MRPIARPLAGALLLAALAGPARAEDIFVDANAAPPGDGSAARPYPTITAGLAHARAERGAGAISPEETIAVHVASGTYLGSFVASGPALEALPLLLDIPNLTLAGATVLTLDASGLPTGTVKGTETVLTVPNSEPVAPPGKLHALVLVGPTVSPVYGLEVGNDVAVEGLVLDGGLNSDTVSKDVVNFGVFVDRVQGALVRANVARYVEIGVESRLAGCRVEGNLISNTRRPGVMLTAGSTASPATVAVVGNRISNMTNGIVLSGTGDVGWLPDLGTQAGAFSLDEMQTIFDLASPLDAANLPDTLFATVDGNDVSNCYYASLHLPVAGGAPYTTANASQPIVGHIVASARGNSFTHNRNFGVFVGAFVPRSDPREYTGTVDLDLAANDLSKNSANPAFFGFTAVSAETSNSQANAGAKYLHEATIRATAADAELTGFGIDNPIVDPVDGTALEDTLIVNGASVPPGTPY
jgi:hypothetical protein